MVKDRKTLYNIIILDEKLEFAERWTEGWVKILRDLIIELNIFDGLSHNTASIMKSIIEQEVKECGGKNLEEFRKVQTIMDTKELRDPLAIRKRVLLTGDWWECDGI